MAITSQKSINARSPYYVKVTTGYSAELKLYILSGNSSSLGDSANLRYTIEKVDNSSLGYVVFEIGALVRDYFDIDWASTTADALWVRTSIRVKSTSSGSYGSATDTDYIAYDGYGYHEDGANPRATANKVLMQDNNDIYFIDTEPIRIPLFSDVTSLSLDYSGGNLGTTSTWASDNFYWSAPTGTTMANDLSVSDTQSLSRTKLKYVYITNAGELEDGETITASMSGGSDEVYTLRKTRCTIHEKKKLIFTNKYGALQELWVQFKSSTSITKSSDDFKRANFDTSSLSYNTYEHQKKTFNVIANERITVNTDFLLESMNEPIKQLMMSEQVWLDEEGTISPVNVMNTETQIKTNLNDKLIQYTFELEYAFNKINDIK